MIIIYSTVEKCIWLYDFMLSKKVFKKKKKKCVYIYIYIIYIYTYSNSKYSICLYLFCCRHVSLDLPQIQQVTAPARRPERLGWSPTVSVVPSFPSSRPGFDLSPELLQVDLPWAHVEPNGAQWDMMRSWATLVERESSVTRAVSLLWIVTLSDSRCDSQWLCGDLSQLRLVLLFVSGGQHGLELICLHIERYAKLMHCGHKTGDFKNSKNNRFISVPESSR